MVFENEFCIYASTRDPRDPPDIMPGFGGIAAKVHRASVFDLTAEEWAAIRELLLLVRAELHKRLAPDAYTLGWNDAGLHPAHDRLMRQPRALPGCGTAGQHHAEGRLRNGVEGAD